MHSTFFAEVAIGGLHVWNYNKSAEDATRGVRFLEVGAAPANIFFDWFRVSPSGRDALHYRTFVWKCFAQNLVPV